MDDVKMNVKEEAHGAELTTCLEGTAVSIAHIKDILPEGQQGVGGDSRWGRYCELLCKSGIEKAYLDDVFVFYGGRNSAAAFSSRGVAVCNGRHSKYRARAGAVSWGRIRSCGTVGIARRYGVKICSAPEIVIDFSCIDGLPRDFSAAWGRVLLALYENRDVVAKELVKSGDDSVTISPIPIHSANWGCLRILQRCLALGVWPLRLIVYCLQGWMRTFSWKRARRLELFSGLGFHCAVLYVLHQFSKAHSVADDIAMLYCVAAALSVFTLVVRRLHDMGRGLPTLLFALIPVVGPFIVFIFLCWPGERGSNRFGPDPR